MDFDAAFERLIDPAREGSALSLDPKDRGNWTGGEQGKGKLLGSKYGVSAMSYPGEDIAGLTVQRAKDIYRRDYWGPAGCDAAPACIKFDLFDMAVNSGKGNAIRCLQRACGEAQDGVLGPRTLAAVQSMPAFRLAARFNGARLMFMAELPTWPAHGRGWARRVAANLLEV
jgi:lysozyme family protein